MKSSISRSAAWLFTTRKYRLVAAGKLPHVRIGNAIRIAPTVLAAPWTVTPP
jgi:hypothetical protein